MQCIVVAIRTINSVGALKVGEDSAVGSPVLSVKGFRGISGRCMAGNNSNKDIVKTFPRSPRV